MKSYYQPKGKKGKYTLRDNTYRRMWYLIADYNYFKAVQAGEILLEQFKDEKNSVTELEAISSVNFDHYIDAIEAAKKQIPEMYVEHVLDHIINNAKYSDLDFVCEQTLKKWAQRFIWHVAKELGEI